MYLSLNRIKPNFGGAQKRREVENALAETGFRLINMFDFEGLKNPI
jgi:hypothetical protein